MNGVLEGACGVGRAGLGRDGLILPFPDKRADNVLGGPDHAPFVGQRFTPHFAHARIEVVGPVGVICMWILGDDGRNLGANGRPRNVVHLPKAGVMVVAQIHAGAIARAGFRGELQARRIGRVDIFGHRFHVGTGTVFISQAPGQHRRPVLVARQCFPRPLQEGRLESGIARVAPAEWNFVQKIKTALIAKFQESLREIVVGSANGVDVGRFHQRQVCCPGFLVQRLAQGGPDFVPATSSAFDRLPVPQYDAILDFNLAEAESLLHLLRCFAPAVEGKHDIIQVGLFRRPQRRGRHRGGDMQRRHSAAVGRPGSGHLP